MVIFAIGAKLCYIALTPGLRMSQRETTDVATHF